MKKIDSKKMKSLLKKGIPLELLLVATLGAATSCDKLRPPRNQIMGRISFDEPASTEISVESLEGIEGFD